MPPGPPGAEVEGPGELLSPAHCVSGHWENRQRHPGQESAAGALCSGLGSVCFQLRYFYTNGIDSSRKSWNDKMQATATPRSLRSSVLALRHIKKVVPHVRRSEWYIFLICYQIWEERHIQTKFSKVQAPVSLTTQVHIRKRCVRFKYPIEEYTWSLA